MTPSLATDEFEQLRRYVQEACGIAVPPQKSYLIETRLAPLVARAGCTSYRDFYARTKADPDGSLRSQIIDAMTTNETLWFRDDGPWSILRETLLPQLVDRLRRGEVQRVRIWSAACSTGQEPYSVAMTIQDYLASHPGLGVKANAFEIIGTDISPSALFIAMSARYDQLAASRGLSPEMRKRHFVEDGRALRPSPAVRELVRLRRFNLMDAYTELGLFDVVLCRNVMIYFTNETRAEIAKKLHGALRAGGALIVGASESMQGALSLFRLARSGTHLYYEKKSSEKA